MRDNGRVVSPACKSVKNSSADLIVPGPSCVDRTQRRVSGCRFSDVRPPVSISDEALGVSCPQQGQTVLADLGFKKGCRGLMVKASGWQSFDRQFDPYPRVIKVAPLRCSLGCRSESDGRIHQ